MIIVNSEEEFLYHARSQDCSLWRWDGYERPEEYPCIMIDSINGDCISWHFIYIEDAFKLVDIFSAKNRQDKPKTVKAMNLHMNDGGSGNIT